MADRQDQSSSSQPSHPPPPTDPFTRYQTPWDRPEREEQNPFIQFRRFADDQFRAFFSGFPRAFGIVDAPESWQREVERIDERIRKQLDQITEEARQAETQTNKWFELRQRLNKKMDERLHRRPPPQISNTEDNESGCTRHLYPDAMPTTELALYEHLAHPGAVAAATPTRDLALGWDGKQRQGDRDVPAKGEPAHDPLLVTQWQSKRLQPFDNPHDTIPWLFTSGYSPIYLCNPHQPHVDSVMIDQAVNQPLTLSNVVYNKSCGIYEDPNKRLNRRERVAKGNSWADAFEDLVSLQQTGRMVERDFSTYKTPKTWIHDMVARGSLGPTWGFNNHGQLTKLIRGDISTAPAWRDRLSHLEVDSSIPKFADDIIHAVRQVSPEGVKLMDDFVDRTLDSVDEALNNATDRPWQDLSDLVRDEFSKMNEDAANQGHDEQSTSHSDISQSAWSSSSRTWASTDPDGDKSDSILSTTTTTERWTRPDGTVETRRVFKKRFADGREVEEESHDYEHPKQIPQKESSALHEPSLQNAPWPVGPKEDGMPQRTMSNKQTQTPTPVQNELKKRRGGGWFWNSDSD
jgi:hypothetical protein